MSAVLQNILHTIISDIIVRISIRGQEIFFNYIDSKIYINMLYFVPCSSFVSRVCHVTGIEIRLSDTAGVLSLLHENQLKKKPNKFSIGRSSFYYGSTG